MHYQQWVNVFSGLFVPRVVEEELRFAGLVPGQLLQLLLGPDAAVVSETDVQHLVKGLAHVHFGFAKGGDLSGEQPVFSSALQFDRQ